jgi:dephospho-CoA kinase
MKKIFIINGMATVGKDTFVELVSELISITNYSSVEKVKQIAKEIGWDGISKTEKDRKFLSDLKVLTSNYCDMPFQDMEKQVERFNQDNTKQCLFLHIREPEEIKKAVKEFNAKTVLITRNSVEQIMSNMADANVYNYEYDYTIHNDGTIEDLKKVAEQFVKDYIRGN